MVAGIPGVCLPGRYLGGLVRLLGFLRERRSWEQWSKFLDWSMAGRHVDFVRFVVLMPTALKVSLNQPRADSFSFWTVGSHILREGHRADESDPIPGHLVLERT